MAAMTAFVAPAAGLAVPEQRPPAASLFSEAPYQQPADAASRTSAGSSIFAAAATVGAVAAVSSKRNRRQRSDSSAVSRQFVGQQVMLPDSVRSNILSWDLFFAMAQESVRFLAKKPEEKSCMARSVSAGHGEDIALMDPEKQLLKSQPLPTSSASAPAEV